MKFIYIFILVLGMSSCKETKVQQNLEIVQDWLGHKIQFSEEVSFIGYNNDSITSYKPHITKYAILTYIDSIGCFSCKLQLPGWEQLMNELSSNNLGDIPILFIFSPTDKQALISLLRKLKFNYPVCIDTCGIMNRLNKFPKEMEFQTFLLNKDNEVIAVGNPIHNPKIKRLYLQILTGNKIQETAASTTEAHINVKSIDFGSFPQAEKQERKFTLTNTGKNMLVIYDVVTSCGCTKVGYSKEGIRPGEKTELTVIYEAEKAEHFSKTVTVYCNASNSPLRLKVTGDAK